MKFGLNEAEYLFIYDILIQPLKRLGAGVYVFGSRARGDHEKYSDIDILVCSSENLSPQIGEYSDIIENSNFPYKVDVVEARNLAESYRPSVYEDRVEV